MYGSRHEQVKFSLSTFSLSQSALESQGLERQGSRTKVIIIINGITMQADLTPFNMLSLTYAGCSITGVRRSARTSEVTTHSNLLTVSIGITWT